MVGKNSAATNAPLTFQKKFPFERRRQESEAQRRKYPDRVPVIVERFRGLSSSGDLPELDKSKFIVPTDLTFGQFIHVIRKRLPKLAPEKALFMFVGAGAEPEDKFKLPADVKEKIERDGIQSGSVLPPSSQTMQELYEQHHHLDGFLYLRYTGENVFGQSA